MDSIGSLIESLNDDDIETLRGLASSLFSGGGDEKPPEKQSEPQHTDEPSSDGGFDLNSLGKIASVMGMFSGTGSDPRCRMLESLKPLIKEERRHKVDEAVKMLKIIDLVPKLREQGIFQGIF